MSEQSPNAKTVDPRSSESPQTMAVECPKKRLFICCDGTWQDAVKTDYALTNVGRLSRCVKTVSEENDAHVLQVVYYQSGIGRGPSKTAKLVDGGTGRGTVIPYI